MCNGSDGSLCKGERQMGLDLPGPADMLICFYRARVTVETVFMM